ncbi:pancreatic triacylglycerol lipase-like isoform X2 [Leptopilina boulardi]|uniref:pancreatic triacylglycerol lipase-like isoform X2 n=1 Tax=Leptopilina boulardi TaxID=63433 RepID=UPI0021F52FBB|nr:pancreatic triacylglycerol lipase-like isoform X2 [Leptopilina boulardi]
MIKTFKIVILFSPHFTNAVLHLLLGQTFTTKMNNIKDNITDCIENTFPRASFSIDNDKNNKIQQKSFSLPAGGVQKNRKDIQENVQFLLYTPELNGTFELLQFNNSTSVTTSHFDKNRSTRFITHGYMSSGIGSSSYLNFTNCNVIVVDWSQLADDFYPIAAFYVKLVGEYVGAMITFLENMGMNPNTTTLVGHSLGAHVMGIASSSAAHKVKYIYGLDPAMPCFLNAHTRERISPDDAEFVEVIHTSIFGDNQTIGDYDFYPNGGRNQPKCACNLITESACSHSTAFKYFAASLNKTNPPFYSILCKNLDAFKANKCENYETIMGGIDHIPKRKGHYYLYTKATFPYSFGKFYRKKSCSMTQLSMCFFNIINFLFGTHLCYN